MLQSPLSSPTCAGNADAQASQPEPPEPQPGQSAEETWVTVFGFQPSELHVVLREFSKCGDMVQFGSGRQDAVNWVHIHYSVPPRPLSFQLLPHRPVHGVLPSAGSQQHATLQHPRQPQHACQADFTCQRPSASTAPKPQAKHTMPYDATPPPDASPDCLAAAQNKYQAQRALQRNGELLASRTMVGVRRLDARHKAATAHVSHAAFSSLAGPASDPSLANPPRPYHVSAAPSVRPIPSPSTVWGAGGLVPADLG